MTQQPSREAAASAAYKAAIHTVMSGQAEPKPKLTALDRCDRCGAQAYLKAELASGFDLLFCAHHAREHRDALAGKAELQDETGQLTAPA